MTIIVDGVRLKKIEFFEEGDESFAPGVAMARVEVALVGQRSVGESVIVFLVPWHNDFKDLSVQIDSTFEAIAKDLSKTSGLPPQVV